MRRMPRFHTTLCTLLLVFLAGCGPAQPSAPDTSAATTTTSVSAPTEPALPPKPTAELATQPAATSMPTAEPTGQPTVAPTTVPTLEPTAATMSTALLPPNDIWVQSANVVLPLQEGNAPLDFTARSYPTPIYRPEASPDGAYIAYGTERGGLALIDVRTGDYRALIQDGGVAGFAFSPDGQELAATSITNNDWTLQVFELANNGVHVLRSGSTIAPDANTLPLVPSPVAWTPKGLLVQSILYASDAPPQHPTLLNPSDPTGQTDRRVYEGLIIDVYPSPDGTRFAVVTGERPIGGGVPTTQIRVVDQQGTEVAAIRAEQPGLLRVLNWSPDGAMLVYALSPDYQTSSITLHLVSADGLNAQELDLAGQAVSGAFRDVAWRDNATVLLLTEGDQLQLDALSVDSFSTGARHPLRTFAGQQPGEGNGRVLYVPR